MGRSRRRWGRRHCLYPFQYQDTTDELDGNGRRTNEWNSCFYHFRRLFMFLKSDFDWWNGRPLALVVCCSICSCLNLGHFLSVIQCWKIERIVRLLVYPIDCRMPVKCSLEEYGEDIDWYHSELISRQEMIYSTRYETNCLSTDKSISRWLSIDMRCHVDFFATIILQLSMAKHHTGSLLSSVDAMHDSGDHVTRWFL